jgi:hypothetical protein
MYRWPGVEIIFIFLARNTDTEGDKYHDEKKDDPD